jgi:hypothetical protein
MSSGAHGALYMCKDRWLGGFKVMLILHVNWACRQAPMEHCTCARTVRLVDYKVMFNWEFNLEHMELGIVVRMQLFPMKMQIGDGVFTCLESYPQRGFSFMNTWTLWWKGPIPCVGLCRVKPLGGAILRIWGLGWGGSWVQPCILEMSPTCGLYSL